MLWSETSYNLQEEEHSEARILQLSIVEGKVLNNILIQDVLGHLVTVVTAVSDTLPRSVLLGTNVSELSELLSQKGAGRDKEKALVVVTRSQAHEKEAATQQSHLGYIQPLSSNQSRRQKLQLVGPSQEIPDSLYRGTSTRN